VSEPKRDHWGRYQLPHPDTGEEVAWTRATTLAGSIEDQTGITKWKIRSAILGTVNRPDLLALAQSSTADDKKQLDEVADKALIVASADSRSNLGTALHRFTERVDKGEPDLAVPPAHAADVDAYKRAKATGGIETRPDYVERITVVPELMVAGTIDRIVRHEGQIYMADFKTGASLDMAWLKIAIQLALYAHGRTLWDPVTSQWQTMPPVNQDKAIVIHVPAGTGEAVLYWVDIAAGWEAAQVCHRVRELRKSKGLAARFA
jgi:hypothetical protein